MDGTILNQLEALDFLGQSYIMTEFNEPQSLSSDAGDVTLDVLVVSPTAVAEPDNTTASDTDSGSDYSEVITLPPITDMPQYVIPTETHQRHAALMLAGNSARTRRMTTGASRRALTFTPPRGISVERALRNTRAPARPERTAEINYMAENAPDAVHISATPNSLPPMMPNHPESLEALRMLDFIIGMTANVQRLLLRRVSAYVLLNEGAQILRLYNLESVRDFFRFLGEHTHQSTQFRILFDYHAQNKRMISQVMQELRTLRR